MSTLGPLDHLVDYGWVYVALIMLLLSAWDAGYFRKGRHRGEYVEKSEWKPKPRVGTVYITITPDTSLLTLPSLIGPPGPPPPVIDWGSYGAFGDSTFDMAEPIRLRPTVGWVEVGSSDGSGEDVP